MDTMRLLRQLHAADTGHAVPNRSVRHTHLADTPMVVSAYHLANEPGAPIGLVYGTDPDDPHVLAMGNPLNRDVRFAVLGALAHAVVDYLEDYRGYEMIRSGSRMEPIAHDTPQIVTPNAATAAWIGDVLARSTRYLRPDEQPVDPALPLLGAHLTALSQAARSPQSSLLVSATRLLAHHWATGQLGGETETLATILGWIAPHDGHTGRETAADAERHAPPAGPVPGPEFDPALDAAWNQWTAATRRGVDPIEASAEMREAVLRALHPGYQATFAALALLRRLPVAGSDEARHATDRKTWGRHLQRVDNDNARFRSVLDGLAAAKIMQDSEAHHSAYRRQQALDDRLALEELVFTGDALQGEVVAIDADHQLGPRRFAPRITVHTTVPYPNSVGTQLYSTVDDRQSAEVVTEPTAVPPTAGTTASTTVVLELHGGMGHGRPTPDRLPGLGTTVTFIGLQPAQNRRRTLPLQLPWTHRAPEQQVGA